MGKRDRWLAAGLAAGTAVLLVLPVWIAARVAPPGTSFAGFLLNPIDGFSYLAKMREGFDGAWTFRLPYAPDPGPGAFLFPYYLLLGHLAKVVRADLLGTLHAARLLGAFAMFLSIYRLLEEFVTDRPARWFAYGLCLVGGGWGWLGIAYGFAGSDLTIPETTPFLSAYANAHFPVATACFMVAAVGILGGQPGKRRWIAASLLAGAGMALVLPFILLPAVAVFAAGTAVITFQERSAGARSIVMQRLGALAAFLAGAAPWAIYDAWLLWTRPDLAAWTAQNRTPSPAPGSYLLGLAPLLLLALLAVVANRDRRRGVVLLAAWALVQFALLYAPLALQRRLSLGLYVALAGLAALGLGSVASFKWRRVLTILAFASAVPSNLIVIAAGIGGVARGEPLLVQSTDEACAIRWLATEAPRGSLVLAGETAGNRIPAYGAVRVLYGHPFETPDAASELAFVRSLYSAESELAFVLPALRARGVDFVYFGPEEAALGPASWPAQLPIARTCGRVIVAEVPAS